MQLTWKQNYSPPKKKKNLALKLKIKSKNISVQFSLKCKKDQNKTDCVL